MASSTVIPALKSAGEEVTAMFERSNIWRTSIDTLLRKAPSTTRLADVLRDSYEPMWKQQTLSGINSGLDPARSKAFAQSLVDDLHFGKNYQFLSHTINQARIERGPIFAQQVGDSMSIYLRHSAADARIYRKAAGLGPAPYVAPGEVENKVRSAASYLFTSRIAIPHLSQPLNTVLNSGLDASIKSLNELLRSPSQAYNRIIQSGALTEELSHEIQNINAGRTGLFDKLFHQPGFRIIRKYQIVHAALAGEYAAHDAAARILTDPTNIRAQSELKLLGIDYKDILSKGGLDVEHIRTAQFRGADESMFISRGLRTPAAWDENYLARFATMYRHYMFSQGKMIKDSLSRSFQLAKQGDPVPLFKTIAILGAAFPAVGYMIKSAEAIVTGHNPLSDEFRKNRVTPAENIADLVGVKDSSAAILADEWLDAMSHAAGFGIMYSIIRSAKRNALAEVMIGPYGTTLADLGQDLYNLRGQELGRDITTRVPVVGTPLTNLVLPRRSRTAKKEEKGPSY